MCDGTVARDSPLPKPSRFEDHASQSKIAMLAGIQTHHRTQRAPTFPASSLRLLIIDTIINCAVPLGSRKGPCHLPSYSGREKAADLLRNQFLLRHEIDHGPGADRAQAGPQDVRCQQHFPLPRATFTTADRLRSGMAVTRPGNSAAHRVTCFSLRTPRGHTSGCNAVWREDRVWSDQNCSVAKN